MSRGKENNSNATAEAISLAEKIVSMRTENPMVVILSDQLKTMLQGMLERQREAQITALQAEVAALKGGHSRPLQPQEIGSRISISSPAPKKPSQNCWEFPQKPAPRSFPIERHHGIFPGYHPAGDQFPAARGHWYSVDAGRPPMQPVHGRVARSLPSKPGPAEFQKFVEYVTPSMISYLEESDGTAFAEWMATGHTEWLPLIQGLTHNSMPGQSGAPVITAFYRSQPQWWNGIMKACGGNEATFTKFVTDFCAWKPETEAPEREQKADEPESTETERIEV